MDLLKLVEERKHFVAVYLFVRSSELVKYFINKDIQGFSKAYVQVMWDTIEVLLKDLIKESMRLYKVHDAISVLSQIIDYSVEKWLEIILKA